LERKGQSLARIEEAHGDFVEALRKARAAIPPDWRQAVILRPDVEQFVFGPDDIIMTFGQDGLVANVAKYLDGQTVIGVDPAPGANAGVLARFRLNEVGEALQAAAAHAIPVERRVMAEARLDNGESLLALNEIFVGHRSHQSARYALKVGEIVERQSSSGLIVSTGTGLTGWASSILNATGRTLELAPTVPRLGFLVREAWAGPNMGVGLVAGHVDAKPLIVTSEMDDGGTVFADGVESDHMTFAWGQSVTIAPAERRLMLAAPTVSSELSFHHDF
jgi:hypothetical protein